MAARRRRRVSARFFIVIAVLVGTAAAVVLAVGKLTGDGEDPDVTPTPIPTATPAPTPTPKPSLPPGIEVVREESANPATFGFTTEIQINRRTVSSYTRKEPVSFGRDVEYSSVPGILTFGGNNYRNTFTYGLASVSDKRMRRTWEHAVGALGSWSGTGWTGQPLIVQWPEDVRAHLGVDEAYKMKAGFTEVIYPAMDGYIYFLDLDTGKRTRNAIATGVVNKGTACLDPNGYPLLYVGQGIPIKNDKGNYQAYVRVFDLIKNELVYQFGGYDYFAHRDWQAYDGSPLIANDTIVYAGENGVLYTALLNTKFDAAAGTVSIEPGEAAKYNYAGAGYSKKDSAGQRWYGFESSVAAFRQYLFMTDNGGRLQCVDANTFRLKYAVDLTDETDATPVLEESFDNKTVYAYTGSQVKTGNGSLGTGYGYTYHRKINAMTGAIIWEKGWISSVGDSTSSGGTLSTPHVGRGNISTLVIYSVSLTAQLDPTTGEPIQTVGADGATGYTIGGRIVAYNRETGEVAWTVQQSDDYWSSPVVVYDENMKAYLIQCDRGGFVRLYDALTGSELNKLDLGSRIDSTPAVFGNLLVVGTRGKGGSGEAAKIVCVKIS